jgi:recombination protein RecA
MSSAVFPTSAARGRPFAFGVEEVAEVCPQPSGAELFGEGRLPQRVVSAGFPGTFKDSRLAGITPASRLAERPAPEMVSSGIAEIDALTGGLPRGCLTEICGSVSSGRTTLLLSALAAATRRGECCAVVDADDALNPQSVVDAGVELERLLWVRCGENSSRKLLRAGSNTQKKNFVKSESHSVEQPLEQLLRAADLLLESGGFGLIALDLGDLPPQTARRIPLTTWFRFRRAVEHTSTVLLAVERQSIAGSCSSLLIKLGTQEYRIEQHSQFPLPTHAQLLTDLKITAEIVRLRMERKPARSVEITFASKTAWAG